MRSRNTHAGTQTALRRLPLALAATLATVLLATAAHAQLSEDPGEQTGVDTDQTPVAKETKLWQRQHGARFGRAEVVEGSVTTFDTDLYDVAIRNPTLGLAGGSRCKESPVRGGEEPEEGWGRRVSGCERVPALYSYVTLASGDGRWERMELPGEERPGFVGAIAWIDNRRALIVGGDGRYPRREPPYDGRDVTDPAKTDEAGKGRAWLYEDGALEELDLSHLTRDESGRAGMRGMTALDTDGSLGFAGGLGQLWEWRDGRFTGKRADKRSPSSEVKFHDLFEGRVREIRFAGGGQAFAVTSGCCAERDVNNYPRLLAYTQGRGDHGFTNTGGPRGGPGWYVRAYGWDPAEDAYRDAGEEGHAPQRLNYRQDVPDSFYSLTVGPGFRGIGVSVVATPGGPERHPEPASTVSSARCKTEEGGPANPAPRPDVLLRRGSAPGWPRR